jgi:hypothetical protein
MRQLSRKISNMSRSPYPTCSAASSNQEQNLKAVHHILVASAETRRCHATQLATGFNMHRLTVELVARVVARQAHRDARLVQLLQRPTAGPAIYCPSRYDEVRETT